MASYILDQIGLRIYLASHCRLLLWSKCWINAASVLVTQFTIT